MDAERGTEREREGVKWQEPPFDTTLHVQCSDCAVAFLPRARACVLCVCNGVGRKEGGGKEARGCAALLQRNIQQPFSRRPAVVVDQLGSTCHTEHKSALHSTPLPPSSLSHHRQKYTKQQHTVRHYEKSIRTLITFYLSLALARLVNYHLLTHFNTKKNGVV